MGQDREGALDGAGYERSITPKRCEKNDLRGPRDRARMLSGSAWVIALLSSAACASGPSIAAPLRAPRPLSGSEVIEVAPRLTLAPLPRRRVATGLANPRGMLAASDGSLLVAVAGNGDMLAEGSGGLLSMRDRNDDGDFDDPGERTSLLDKQPSRNLLELVRRDEVFGMAGLAAGGGVVLASLAQFGGPSTLFRVDGPRVVEWGKTHGNINDLAYDLRRSSWVAVASTSDEVVELVPGGRSQRIVKIPPLASGQDPVPGYLRFDPYSGDLLVSLFSGSPEGEEGGQGVELVPRSASIVRVHAETRGVEPLVVGLTVPTGLEITEDGSIYVLEFCDGFLDPVVRPEDLRAGPIHGGFRRFSGRLLHIDRARRTVAVIADGLDTPTNLTRAGDALLVAQGMGTPGRPIPGPDRRTVNLTGFIERIALPGPQSHALR